MISFKHFALNENFKNLIGPSSIEKRLEYVDEVWDILQKSYASIGGIKGSGFRSKEDMVKNIPFWKLFTKDGKVVAVAFYKDKGGRKSVAIATDGSDLGKKIVSDIFKSSLKVSYGEKSGRALSTLIKTVPWETLQHFLIKPNDVKKLTGDDITTIRSYGIDNLDPNDVYTYNKFPELRPYMYVRELGGEMHLKVMAGTPGLFIK